MTRDDIILMQRALEALDWYVQTYEASGLEENQFWSVGKRRAVKTLFDLKARLDEEQITSDDIKDNKIKLFNYRAEGELIANGVNVYPKEDKRSSGFIIRIWSLIFRARYSKKLGKWFVNWRWI